MVEAVAFDAMGTLFDLSPLEGKLTELGASGGTREMWFQRLLHSAAVLTVAGRFAPFDELALSTLRSVLAQQDLDPAGAAGIVRQLFGMPAYPDARDAVELLVDAGARILVVTNGGRAQTEQLLERAGLREQVHEIVATEDVQAYKPAAAVYERAEERAAGSLALVAAHGWDAVGAAAAGLEAVWVDRVERLWPFPFAEPRLRASSLVEAAQLLTR
jgi:2-haloacid dehalogenase